MNKAAYTDGRSYTNGTRWDILGAAPWTEVTAEPSTSELRPTYRHLPRWAVEHWTVPEVCIGRASVQARRRPLVWIRWNPRKRRSGVHHGHHQRMLTVANERICFTTEQAADQVGVKTEKSGSWFDERGSTDRTSEAMRYDACLLEGSIVHALAHSGIMDELWDLPPQ